MVSGLFHIKLNSDEDNKDNGFYALLTSGSSIACLKDEEFIVPAEAIKKLNDKKIKYEVVPEKKVVCKNLGEKEENATKTEI